VVKYIITDKTKFDIRAQFPVW